MLAYSMVALRFLSLLALVVWVGGIIFFAFVVAPALFSVLPSRHLSGLVVTRALARLHWIGIACGVVFLVCSMLHSWLATGEAQPAAARHLLVVAMLALTLVSEVGVSSRMHRLRASMGVIDDVPATDARRVEFNRMHRYSTIIESIVLLLGLATIYFVAAESAASRHEHRPPARLYASAKQSDASQHLS
jgi:uncharacterized membrane protein